MSDGGDRDPLDQLDGIMARLRANIARLSARRTHTERGSAYDDDMARTISRSAKALRKLRPLRRTPPKDRYHA